MKFRVANFVAATTAVALLGACGGGDSPTPTPTPTPPPTTTLNVTLSASSADVIVEEGGSATFGFDATYTGSSTDDVVADVTVDARRYMLAGTPGASGKTFSVNLETVPFPAGGKSTSEVTFRLCKTSACTTVYPGSTKTFTVNLNVQVGDWGMFQRDAAHHAMVNVRYDTDDFERAWEWTAPSGFALDRKLSATRDRFFATLQVADNGGRRIEGEEVVIYGINTFDGSVEWKTSLGKQWWASAPSYADGKVFVVSMEAPSYDNPLWILDAKTGAVIAKGGGFASQYHRFNQPTVFGDSVFVAAGYDGNITYAFDTTSGLKKWEAEGSAGKVRTGQSVAADDNYVYYYSGNIDVFDRRTGTLVKTLEDPYPYAGFYEWRTAPIPDGKGNVFALWGEAAPNTGIRLAAYSMATGFRTWRTDKKGYRFGSAYKDDLLFVAHDSVIDAINTADGSVAYNFLVPEGGGTWNVVRTENLLFAKSAGTIYAYDVNAGGRPIWKRPAVNGPAGLLAITPDNYLLISLSGKVQAFKLF